MKPSFFKHIFLFTLIIFIISCNKESKKCPTSFRVPVNTIPYDECYYIGDTLTLYSAYNYNIYEENTNEYYNMRNLDIASGLTIYNLDTSDASINQNVNSYVDILPSAEYIYYIENYSDNNSALISNIILDGDTFRNEIRIVFKRKGLFMLIYGPSSLENNMEFDGKCRNHYFDVLPQMNFGKTNNLNLLKDSPNEHFNNWVLQDPDSRFYGGGAFAYRVID